MPVQPEPILDVVRGLSTVASFAIVVNQLKTLYDEFFISVCARCRGTGCLTCPHCHGTKTLRRTPGFLRARDLAIVDNPADKYECFYCGPATSFDFNPMAPDDEPTALKIQENLKAAVANIWPRPFDAAIGVLAGTVPCTECNGNPRVRRLTPDFAKALGLEEPWQFQITRRIGSYKQHALDGRRPRRQYLEYPSSAPVPVEMPSPSPPPPPNAPQKEDSEESGFRISHQSAFTLEDYVLNYVSDDEKPRLR